MPKPVSVCAVERAAARPNDGGTAELTLRPSTGEGRGVFLLARFFYQLVFFASQNQGDVLILQKVYLSPPFRTPPPVAFLGASQQSPAKCRAWNE